MNEQLVWTAIIERVHPHTLQWVEVDWVFPTPGNESAPREEVEYHAERVMRWKQNADPEEQYRLACKQMTLRELEEKRQAGGIWNERDILGD